MAILPPIKQGNQAGSGFTNIQRILQANKTNQLGSTINQGVQQAGTAARGNMNTAGQQFQTQVGAEKTRLNNEGQRVSSVLGGNLQNVSDEDTKAFEQIRGAQSKGPTDIKNANEVRAQAQEAENLGKAGGSEGGRFGLLQRFIGRGANNYTGGQQRLDSVLLGQTGANQLRQARNSTLGLDNQAVKQSMAAQAQGQELKGQALNLRDQTIGKLNQSVSGYDTAMQAQLAAQQAQREAELHGITDPMNNSAINIDQSRLNQLKEASGGYLGDGSKVLNVNLNDYIKQNLMDANKQSAQGDTDFSKISSLAKLSGEDLGETGNKLVQDYTARPGDVGKFLKSNLFDVQTGGLADAVNSSQANYDSSKADADNQKYLAARFLGGAKPGEYQVSGGYMGDLLNAYTENKNNSARGNAQNMLNTLQNNNNRSNEDTQKMQLLQSYIQGGAQNLGPNNQALLDEIGYMNPGTTNEAIGRALGQDAHNGSQFMQNVWSPLQGQVDAAKAWANANGRGELVSNISKQEAALKAAEERGNALGDEFKTLRAFKAKPAASTT